MDLQVFSNYRPAADEWAGCSLNACSCRHRSDGHYGNADAGGHDGNDDAGGHDGNADAGDHVESTEHLIIAGAALLLQFQGR